MTGAFQASLLDVAQDAGLRELGGSVRRTTLAQGAWLDVLPGWVTGADALFERLIDTVPWRAERRQMYDRVVDVPRLRWAHRAPCCCARARAGRPFATMWAMATCS